MNGSCTDRSSTARDRSARPRDMTPARWRASAAASSYAYSIALPRSLHWPQRTQRSLCVAEIDGAPGATDTRVIRSWVNAWPPHFQQCWFPSLSSPTNNICHLRIGARHDGGPVPHLSARSRGDLTGPVGHRRPCGMPRRWNGRPAVPGRGLHLPELTGGPLRVVSPDGGRPCPAEDGGIDQEMVPSR